MFVDFFFALKQAGLPVSLRECLTLLDAVKAGVASKNVDDFYYLSRSSLVKDETRLDRFDQVFGTVFKGLETLDEVPEQEIPEEWLRKLAEKFLTEEEKAEIESLGGFEKLMETLRERLKEQEKRHQGGSKWIGTGGTSPFGAYGYNPEGIRIGQQESRHRRAVKVWDKRRFRDLDSDVEIGTRNIKMALRHLRKFARQGAEDELDLDNTISKSANRGYIDIVMRPERRNAVKLLLFFDIGGSMDDHVLQCEELFSAARLEFRTLEYYYFHNCVYEYLWKENGRRHTHRIPTYDVLNTYGPDYRVIFVGDASMSPYEIAYPGGSVEHWNEEAGNVWLQRMRRKFPRSIWLNPVPEKHWGYTHSIQMIRDIFETNMFPLNIEGLETGMKTLNRLK